jgi:hypothetical protein
MKAVFEPWSLLGGFTVKGYGSNPYPTCVINFLFSDLTSMGVLVSGEVIIAGFETIGVNITVEYDWIYATGTVTIADFFTVRILFLCLFLCYFI